MQKKSESRWGSRIHIGGEGISRTYRCDMANVSTLSYGQLFLAVKLSKIVDIYK